MSHEGLAQELREYARRGEKLLGGGSLCIRAAGAIDILDRLCDRYEAENKQRSDTIHALVVECNWLRAENKKLTEERDAAIKELQGECFACKNHFSFPGNGKCKNCRWDTNIIWLTSEKYQDNWEWHGVQEE